MHSLTSGIAIGGVTGVSLMLAEVAITGNTNVPIEIAVTVAVFCCGVVWYLGRKFQAIEDKLHALAEKVENLPCKPHNKRCE